MLYLDAAQVEDVQRAFSTGLVNGITTNPSIIARTGRTALEIIAELCDLSSGIVFHQLTGQALEMKKKEAFQMAAIRPTRIGLKIPCTYQNLSLAAELVSSGYVVGITAIFTPAQVFLACQAGAKYILPYVNRS